MSVVDQEQVLDYVFSSLYSVYSLIGIILNSFLLGLIVFYKQTSLKEYRILLGNTTCSLLLLSVLNFFLQLRFVIAGDSLGYVALGPARFLNLPRLNLFCTALMLTLDIYSFMTIAMCMAFKYRTLVDESPSARQIFVAISLFFLLPLSTGISLLIYNPDFQQLHEILEKLRPEDQLQRYGNYCGLPDAKNAYVLYLIVVICSIGVGSYMVMIAAGVKIHSYVLSSYNKMSPQSSKAFNMMVKALVIQSFMPVFFSFPTKILYLLAQFTTFHSIIAEYLMFAMSPIVAVVDPCITLYYILPYRKFVTGMLGFSKREASSKVLSTDTVTKASTQPFALKSIAD
ncbi:hypothetical protein Q1695_011110 [Nippostrongylus brasiliensis]|nr:hypothetical protein Q1695_011110 [Nippostrongylus brasiliensis]